MLLTELKKPTLQEACGCIYVYDIFETLTAKFDSIQWKTSQAGDIGDATLDEDQFRLHLEPRTFSIGETELQFINIAFSKIVDNKPTEELQLSNKRASSVVGAVVVALLDRLKKYDYDAIVFVAADNVERRLSLYNAIADRKWVKGKLGDVVKNIHLDNGGACTVLLAKDLPYDVKSKFFDFLKSRGK